MDLSLYFQTTVIPKTSIICSPVTNLKTSIKTITYLSDISCMKTQESQPTLLSCLTSYLQLTFMFNLTIQVSRCPGS
ncbi:hypothetical protein EGA65_12330 [Salmonella enterica]|nr:hypothetical protein [Salmonella enterica]